MQNCLYDMCHLYIKKYVLLRQGHRWEVRTEKSTDRQSLVKLALTRKKHAESDHLQDLSLEGDKSSHQLLYQSLQYFFNIFINISGQQKQGSALWNPVSEKNAKEETKIYDAKAPQDPSP